ncbi:MAG TPA: hypothetical protein VGG16_15075 [Streptosporangiaceae bacterium]|jgi:hypothetical protein
MPASSQRNVIFNNVSAQTVLGIDFADRKRREASFAELATRIGSGYRFLQTRPVTVPQGQWPSSEEYILSWVEDARRDGNPMRAVLGHCVGSVYAAAVAERISQWQPEPDVILFDPQLASLKSLGDELRKEISANSSLMSDDEIERAREITNRISYLDPSGVARIAAHAVESYLEVITPAFERAGLGTVRGSKLYEYFVSYMAWLSVAAELDPSRALKKSIVIMSHDYAKLPNRMLPDDYAGNSAVRWIACDVSHAELLRSDSVAKEVLDLLESR